MVQINAYNTTTNIYLSRYLQYYLRVPSSLQQSSTTIYSHQAPRYVLVVTWRQQQKQQQQQQHYQQQQQQSEYVYTGTNQQQSEYVYTGTNYSYSVNKKDKK